MLAHGPPIILIVWIYVWAGLHGTQVALMVAALRNLHGRRGIAAYALSGVASLPPIVAVTAVLAELAGGPNLLGPPFWGFLSPGDLLLAAIKWFSLPLMLISIGLDANPKRHTCSFLARVLGTLAVLPAALMSL